jgi:hypothetical protein
MKNIHVLPTDKPSRLFFNDGELCFRNSMSFKEGDIPKHIYITSDEEIKQGDWYLNVEEKNGIKNPFYGKLYKANQSIGKVSLDYLVNNLKKIILTTDPDLIKAGVQAIDNEFLEWFVKNPSCEYIKIDIELYPCDSQGNEIIFSQPANLGGSEDYRNNIKTFIEQEHLDNRNFIKAFDRKRFKIIIPQEEPKQENCCTPVGQIKRYVDCVGCDRKPKQETLEDPDAYWLSSSKKEREWQEEKLKEIFEHYPNAAPRYQYLNGLIQMALENIARKNFLETLEEAAERIYDDNLFDYEKYRYGFIEGAKWQAERMYSEEDMKQFGLYLGDNLKKLKNKSIDEIFEQFKNI